MRTTIELPCLKFHIVFGFKQYWQLENENKILDLFENRRVKNPDNIQNDVSEWPADMQIVIKDYFPNGCVIIYIINKIESMNNN